MQRRNFIAASAITIAAMAVPSWAWTEGKRTMFGLISKMMTVPGKRDELMTILLSGVDKMPGCLSYIVAADENDANAIWVTEVWETKASHDESLSLPSVKEAIAKGRPLIAGFGERFVTAPAGGHGLVRPNVPTPS